MKNVDSAYEQGPAIFKEEIYVEESPILNAEESSSRDTTDSSNPDDKTSDHRRSPEAVPDIVEDIIQEEPEEELEDQLKLDLNEPRVKLGVDVREELGYRIPMDAYGAERVYGLDLMSVRTEDEVSELPDSEIASLISDRKAELERRDSDVSLSDREYSDKDDDDNVVISDSDEDSKPLYSPRKTQDKSSEDQSESSTDSSKSDRETQQEVTEQEQTVLDESFEGSESLGAIPARVYGDQYFQEINNIRGQLYAPDSVIAEHAKPADEPVNVPDFSQELIDLSMQNVNKSDKESDSSHESDDEDKPDITDNDEILIDIEVPEKVAPVAFARLNLDRESSDSESDLPNETRESNLDITTDLETTGDLETTMEREEAHQAALAASDRDTPSKTTTDDDSTVKEEFYTNVDPNAAPQQMILIKDYVSSSEDETQRIQLVAMYPEDRSDSPVIESGFVEETELSRISEEHETDETSDTDSTNSADSVRHVDIPIRDEVLQTVLEESESGEVSMEMPQEGDISDTSFDVDQSYNVESPLAKSTLTPTHAAAPSEVNFLAKYLFGGRVH